MILFLTWDNQSDAENSIAAINIAYGCPYEAENGYRMDQWDAPVRSHVTEDCGFFKPEEHLGKSMPDLMPVLVSGFVENREKPNDFNLPKDEEEIE